MNFTDHIIYVNAYYVSREYGGGEEGGWWYNSGEIAAQVPVRLKCEQESWEELTEDDRSLTITEVTEASISIEEDRVRVYLQVEKQYLLDTLRPEEWGNISSVNGGMEVQVKVETKPAKNWPENRPHYE